MAEKKQKEELTMKSNIEELTLEGYKIKKAAQRAEREKKHQEKKKANQRKRKNEKKNKE